MMPCWQVEALSHAGAGMTFGLAAPDDEKATALALELLPFVPCQITVTEIPSRGKRQLPD
jgi:hypothetical protein